MEVPSVRLADQLWRARMQNVDLMIRAHEHTHLAVLGPYARGVASYSTVSGPGGERYAVGGSVGVDLTPVPGDPEATIRKARLIRMAATAVMNPSPADMRIAADAYRMEMQARRELDREGQAGGKVDLYA